MLEKLNFKFLGHSRNKIDRRVKKIEQKIDSLDLENRKARVVILNLGPTPYNSPGKVDPALFFPTFCNVLEKCGIASAYIHSKEKLNWELSKPGNIPTIIINLVHENFDELNTYRIPLELSQKVEAIFNSTHAAKVIRDKLEANRFLSEHGINMPSLNPGSEKRIFSNARIGTHEEVFLYDSVEEADPERYNTEYIDTTFDIGSRKYFTTIRLMCVGSSVVQIYVRASDTENNNPSVHSRDTVLDYNVISQISESLVKPNLENYHRLAKDIDSALGPGFYSHDLLVDRNSGTIYLSETGFKFYDSTYFDHMHEVIGDHKFIDGVMDIETYAAYAASVFVTYCAGKGFI